jgi:hypothetical protein
LSAHLFFLKQGLVEEGLCSRGAFPKRPLSSGVRAANLMLFLSVFPSEEQALIGKIAEIVPMAGIVTIAPR